MRSPFARLFGTGPATDIASEVPDTSAPTTVLPEQSAPPLAAAEASSENVLALTLDEAIAEVKAGRRDTFEVRFLARELERKQQLDEDTAELAQRLEQVVTGRLRAAGRLEEGTTLRLTLPVASPAVPRQSGASPG